MLRKMFAVLAIAGLSACGDSPIDPIQKDPILSITSTPSGAVVSQPTPSAVRINFAATVENGNANTVSWYRDGVAVGQSRTYVLDLNAGESARVCAKYLTLEQCEDKRVTRAGLPAQVYEARPGNELPVVGVRACYTAVNQPSECVSVQENGQLIIRPSWFDLVSLMRVCLEGDSIETLCVDISSDKFYTPVKFIVLEYRWRIPAGTYAGTVIEVSTRKGYELSSADPLPVSFNTWMSPPLTPRFVPLANRPLKVKIVMDSVFTEENRQVIMAVLRGMEERIGMGPLVTFVEGVEWNGCNAVLIRGSRAQYGSSAGGGGCGDDTNPVISGGVVTLGMMSIRSDRLHTEHEFGHIIGLHHTCAWVSVMANCGEVRSTVLTEIDVSYLQARDRVLELMLKYGVTLEYTALRR